MLTLILWMFLFYGFLGWIWETSFVSFKKKRYINRGFLRSPFIPIYGFAITTMMVSMQLFSNQAAVKLWWQHAAAMVFLVIIAALWEYITSYLMEMAFSTRWWDYSDQPANLHGRIALIPSVFWGVAGYLLWLFVQPIIHMSHDLVMRGYGKKIIASIYFVLIVDAYITVFELIKLRQILIRIQTGTEKLFSLLSQRIDDLEKSRSNMKQLLHLQDLIRELRQDLKDKVTYRRLNALDDFDELLNQVRNKMNLVNSKKDSLPDDLEENIICVKRFRRFFRKYPDMLSHRMTYVYHLLRKLRRM